MQSKIDITPSNTLYYWREVIWIYGKTRNFISHFMFKKQSTKVINMMVVCVVVLVRCFAVSIREIWKYANRTMWRWSTTEQLTSNDAAPFHFFDILSFDDNLLKQLSYQIQIDRLILEIGISFHYNFRVFWLSKLRSWPYCDESGRNYSFQRDHRTR